MLQASATSSRAILTFFQNDLDLDHFCHDIIRAELLAITSLPVPDPQEWAFLKENDCVFGAAGDIRAPEDWVKKGELSMRRALERGRQLYD